MKVHSAAGNRIAYLEDALAAERARSDKLEKALKNAVAFPITGDWFEEASAVLSEVAGREKHDHQT